MDFVLGGGLTDIEGGRMFNQFWMVAFVVIPLMELALTWWAK